MGGAGGRRAPSRSYLPGLLIVLGLAAFCAVFVVADNAYFRFADPRFPHVGASAWFATLWGLVSRVHLVVFMLPFILWRPRLFGFQIGQTRRYWRMLLLMLLANCGVIAAYLWLTGSGTPFSGNRWLVTEIVIVPVIEETFWRGLVLTGSCSRSQVAPGWRQHASRRVAQRRRVWPAARQQRRGRRTRGIRRGPGAERGDLGGDVRVCTGQDGERLPAHAAARGDEPGRGAVLAARQGVPRPTEAGVGRASGRCPIPRRSRRSRVRRTADWRPAC